MAARTIKRLFYGAVGVAGVGLAVIALFLLGQSAQNTEEFDRLYPYILLTNIAAVVALLALTIGNLARLLSDYRKHIPGSKLKARMVGMFVGLAILPGRFGHRRFLRLEYRFERRPQQVDRSRVQSRTDNRNRQKY